MYRHDVNYISEPNGRCCFLKGAHSSRKAKQLGTRNEWIWGYMGVQGLTTCPVLARGATSRGEALAAHTPQAAPSYRGSATLHWGHGTRQCCPPSSSSSTCQGQEELNLGNFFPHTHTTSYRCLNCWGFVHLVQFIPNNSGSRFSPPLGTPFLSLAAEPDPGASRIEPQEVPTASSRLWIPSWVLNALHQRAVGHHINQELWNPPRHLVGNGYRVLASLKHNLKDFGVILRLFLSFSPVSM